MLPLHANSSPAQNPSRFLHMLNINMEIYRRGREERGRLQGRLKFCFDGERKNSFMVVLAAIIRVAIRHNQTFEDGQPQTNHLPPLSVFIFQSEHLENLYL